MSDESVRAASSVVHIPNGDPAVDYRLVPTWEVYAAGIDGSVWTRIEKIRASAGRGFHFVCGNTWNRMVPGINKRTGHQYVRLRFSGRNVFSMIHKIVLETFGFPKPHGLQCRHLDGQPCNNRLSNLTWGTALENQRDRYRHGTDVVGERNGRAVLSECDVRQIRHLYRSGRTTHRGLASTFGVSDSTIGFILSRKTWTHVADD